MKLLPFAEGVMRLLEVEVVHLPEAEIEWVGDRKGVRRPRRGFQKWEKEERNEQKPQRKTSGGSRDSHVAQMFAARRDRLRFLESGRRQADPLAPCAFNWMLCLGPRMLP